MKSLIGDMKFYRMVLIVCIPIVIQNGFTNLASLLDNVMIGQLGTLSMSGVSISNQLFQVFNVRFLVQCQVLEYSWHNFMDVETGMVYTIVSELKCCLAF
mgnify:CR=1 FL=1